jgi:dTDP-4-dehydrorhamnose reductase
MRILLTGRNGQAGWELERKLQPLGEIRAFGRDGLDLSILDQIVARVREVKPDVIVNAAAYTAVDRAESEPDLAFTVNSTAPGVLAEEARRLDALLVHYSTDYVFDGTKREPYTEEDEPNPINTYGRSKLEGERAISQSDCRHLILRTSWIYASRGENFLLTVLRLARERRELHVVNDQVGSPTWAAAIAGLTVDLLQTRVEESVVLHATATGTTTWYDFAGEALRISGLQTPIRPVRTEEFPRPARRPAYSVLDNGRLKRCFGVSLASWQEQLRSCLQPDT